eukprot:gnl/TRDRNA2_/TRDRNA2_44503_c0_seq1.p1 gnl/TRDRNA2_/TRDRNA2_44503_c0~~gnl/TRDRNA2_/TRDRNA2_44503_c0_seq1.p1  ORF type:complete len:483 (+),score=88.90 gnl/TRDRNA2_/TRDRNA2_44503_c0_seq1:66-1451(+)
MASLHTSTALPAEVMASLYSSTTPPAEVATSGPRISKWPLLVEPLPDTGLTCQESSWPCQEPAGKARSDSKGRSDSKSRTVRASPFVTLEVGAGGVMELQSYIDDATVSWALLRFQVGSGTFVRTKLVAVHCNGGDTPVMLRGRLNARMKEVLALLGEVHAIVEVTHAQELTLEYLCERLLPLFAADDLGECVKSLYLEYTKMVEAMTPPATPTEVPELAAPPAVTARDRIERGERVTALEALKELGADKGHYNWVLLEPKKLELHNAGYGGLEELRSFVVDDQVLFGVVRLSFGCSTRTTACVTKHVFVHWVGPRVGAVQRGLMNGRLGRAVALVGSCCAITFRREAHSCQDLLLEDLVREVRCHSVVDRVAGATSSRISVEEYLKALEHEVKSQKAQENATVLPEIEPPSPPVGAKPELRTAVQTVRSSSGEWNWALFGVQKSEPAPRLPSTPVVCGGA